MVLGVGADGFIAAFTVSKAEAGEDLGKLRVGKWVVGAGPAQMCFPGLTPGLGPVRCCPRWRPFLGWVSPSVSQQTVTFSVG